MSALAVSVANNSGPIDRSIGAFSVYVCYQKTPGGKSVVYNTPVSNISKQETPPLTDLLNSKKQFLDAINSIWVESCKDEVRHGYGSEKAGRSNILMILAKYGEVEGIGGRKSLRPTPIAFSLLAEKPDGGILLDIICAIDKGGLLLDYILSFANKYAYIELHSLAHVLGFYPKKGFEFRTSCDEAPRINYAEYAIPREAVASKSKNAIVSPPYIRLMGALKDANLHVKRTDGCDEPGIDAGTFFTRGCHEDGYYMFKCQKKTGGSRTRRDRRGGKRSKTYKRK